MMAVPLPQFIMSSWIGPLSITASTRALGFMKAGYSVNPEASLLPTANTARRVNESIAILQSSSVRAGISQRSLNSGMH